MIIKDERKEVIDFIGCVIKKNNVNAQHIMRIGFLTGEEDIEHLYDNEQDCLNDFNTLCKALSFKNSNIHFIEKEK